MKNDCQFKPGDRVRFTKPWHKVRVGALATVQTPAFLTARRIGRNEYVIRIGFDTGNLTDWLNEWPPEDYLEHYIPETKMDDTRSYLAAVTEGV